MRWKDIWHVYERKNWVRGTVQSLEDMAYGRQMERSGYNFGEGKERVLTVDYSSRQVNFISYLWQVQRSSTSSDCQQHPSRLRYQSRPRHRKSLFVHQRVTSCCRLGLRYLVFDILSGQPLWSRERRIFCQRQQLRQLRCLDAKVILQVGPYGFSRTSPRQS